LNPNLPIIVGESNPYGAGPHYALYPDPPGCAGERLCHRVMGLRRGTYLSSFERVNLLQGPKWSAPLARMAAAEMRGRTNRVVILLGRRVAEAFGYRGAIIPSGEDDVLLPHPSGRNRIWNREMVMKCRKLLCLALPSLPFGEVDELPLLRDVLGERVPGAFFKVQFECVYCKSEPDYRGTCSCSHAPCVHQADVNRRSK
jgi:hypothetical protein